MSTPAQAKFQAGDWVEKVTGDYTFQGQVMAVFGKRTSGAVRLVVENNDGLLHIFSESQLVLRLRNGVPVGGIKGP